jgi:hypothetical protein
LTKVQSLGNGHTRVTGTFQSAPNTTFVLDFYASATEDPSGHGQGQTYLGSVTVTTDANGYLVSSPDGSAIIINPGTPNATFIASGLAAMPAGEDVLSATATNLMTGDTSEFSNDVLVHRGRG